MLIPGVPLLVTVENLTTHSTVVYTDINSIPEPAKSKALSIINSPIRVSRINVKIS